MTDYQAQNSTLTTEKKLSINWFSNAPWSATGYGNQTRLFVPRLKRAGYDMSLTAFYGLDGHTLQWVDDITIYPKSFHTYGQDVMAAHAITAKADVVISLMDAWVCEPDNFPQIKWIPWFPIDSEPVTKINVDKITQAYKRLVFSKHACKMMDNAGLDYDYIPHGVDTNVFKPMDRAEARKIVNLPADAFIVGMVAANKGFPPRKAFAENISAFKMLKEKHPDALLYLHTSNGARGEGFDIAAFVDLIGLEMDKDVILAEQYNYMLSYPDPVMNALYNAFDVHMLVSKGEGFGIPILEAQAAGCPVIVGDWTSMGELCFSGWKLDKQTEAEPEYTQYGAYWFVPHIDAIYQRLENAYQKKDNKVYRERARDGSLAYDADLIVKDYWIPYLDKLADELKSAEVQHTHRWARTGLWNSDGSMSTPCITCNDELKDNVIIKNGFAPDLGNVKLHLEPDNDGVSKIVMREIKTDYKLDDLDLKAGDVVVDIGAHKGVVSCYLAKRYPGVRVIAFEPNRANYEVLLKNIEKNGVEVTAGLCAVTKDGRLVNIAASESNSGGGTIYSGSPGDIPSVTLQEIFEDYGIDRIALLKIDCEGAEFEILRSYPELLNCIDRIRGEFHGSSADIYDLLAYVRSRVRDVQVTELVS